MGIQNQQIISVDYKGKKLYLEDNNQTQRHIIGPYLAMYNYRYREFEWDNWIYKESPTLQKLQQITESKKWEEYVFSIIVDGNCTEEDIKIYISELGYVPDYILQKQWGKIEILHKTNRIDLLKKEGYTLRESDLEFPNYSFGMGLYCFDKKLFDKYGDNWYKEQDNVYIGEYEGEYLRCIYDTNNGDKDGSKIRHIQELLIPFNDKDINWL